MRDILKRKKEIDDLYNTGYHLFKSFITPRFNLKTGKSEGEATELVNVYPNSKRELKAVFFKTFRGMVQELKRVNKNCKKYNSKVEIRFQLPIKW